MREFSRRNAIALALGATGGLFALPCRYVPTRRYWRSGAMTRSPISPSANRSAGCRTSSMKWDEHRYHFASAEHRELFKVGGTVCAAVRRLLHDSADRRTHTDRTPSIGWSAICQALSVRQTGRTGAVSAKSCRESGRANSSRSLTQKRWRWSKLFLQRRPLSPSLPSRLSRRFRTREAGLAHPVTQALSIAWR